MILDVAGSSPVTRPKTSRELVVARQRLQVRCEAAGGLKTVVTWTLTPTKGGVLARLEQSGFRPEDEANYQGANYGWQRFLGGLERVAAGLG